MMISALLVCLAFSATDDPSPTPTWTIPAQLTGRAFWENEASDHTYNWSVAYCAAETAERAIARIRSDMAKLDPCDPNFLGRYDAIKVSLATASRDLADAKGRMSSSAYFLDIAQWMSGL